MRKRIIWLPERSSFSPSLDAPQFFEIEKKCPSSPPAWRDCTKMKRLTRNFVLYSPVALIQKVKRSVCQIGPAVSLPGAIEQGRTGPAPPVGARATQ